MAVRACLACHFYSQLNVTNNASAPSKSGFTNEFLVSEGNKATKTEYTSHNSLFSGAYRQFSIVFVSFVFGAKSQNMKDLRKIVLFRSGFQLTRFKSQTQLIHFYYSNTFRGKKACFDLQQIAPEAFII